MCRTTVIFGTLKGGSLEINSLALINNLFQLQKCLPKWHQRFVKNAFTSMWSKYLSNNVWRDFRLLMSALATVALKMGPWVVLVSPSFRENVAATSKIGSFLYSLDNLLQKSVIVFSFGNQISKWRSFEKRAIFDLLFTFFSHQGKVTNIHSAYISLTYMHVFCSPY